MFTSLPYIVLFYAFQLYPEESIHIVYISVELAFVSVKFGVSVKKNSFKFGQKKPTAQTYPQDE